MSFWNETNGGGLIHSSTSSYREYALTGTLQLSWPLESSRDAVIADYMSFSSPVPTDVVMPDARQGSTGVICEVANDGLGPITLKTILGGTIGVILPSQVFRIILRDNSQRGGSWRTVLLGATTALAQAASLQSDTVVAQGNTLVQALPVLNIATDYAVSTAERGSLINWRGGVGVITLDTTLDLKGGWFIHIRNSGDGTLAIRPPVPEKIDDTTEVLLNPGQSIAVVSDGQSFSTLLRSYGSGSGGAGGSGAFSYASIDISGAGNYVMNADEIGSTAYRFTGALTGNRTVIVPAAVAEYWVRNQTSGGFTLTVTTQSAIDGGRPGQTVQQSGSKILYCNGPDVFDASTNGIAIPVAVSQGGTGGTTTGEARSNLGFTSVGNALATAASMTSARAAIDAVGASNPIFAGSASFVTNGTGPKLSNGGWLYDDATTHKATILRTQLRKFQLRDDAGSELLLDIDGGANRFMFKGQAVLSGANVPSEILQGMTQATAALARPAILGGPALSDILTISSSGEEVYFGWPQWQEGPSFPHAVYRRKIGVGNLVEIIGTMNVQPDGLMRAEIRPQILVNGTTWQSVDEGYDRTVQISGNTMLLPFHFVVGRNANVWHMNVLQFRFLCGGGGYGDGGYFSQVRGIAKVYQS